MFNYHHAKYPCLTDTLLNNINQNTNVNLINDNSHYNRNSNVENKIKNSINNSSANSFIDHDNSRNLGNSNRISSDNYVDDDINNECNNTRELVNVMNSNSNEPGFNWHFHKSFHILSPIELNFSFHQERNNKFHANYMMTHLNWS